MPDPRPLLLDTHIWLDYANAAPELSSSVVSSINAARRSGALFVSVISIWEIALLVRRRRLHLLPSPARWTEEALRLRGLNLLPFSPEIAISAVDLPASMHKDPADRILVASALIENLTLVTRDREILTFAKATHLTCLPV